ncbi:hypothetical protein ACHAXR_005273 [Thalassiosira sp. AJA248-18]
MKLSNAILPTTSGGSPPRSPRGSFRALGVLHAVTLAATAAFAAGSTALLCVLFLSSQAKNGNLLGIQARLDWPNHAATVKCDSSPIIRNRRHYGRRRSILPDTQTFGGDANSTEWPTGVIWLMNTTTATNYGLEGDIKDEESVPAFKDGVNGPFFELIPGRSTNIPKLILTKTHCGGFATSLKPGSFIETNRSFLKSCLKGKRGVYSPDNNSFTTQSVWYSQDLVKKVLHIFRNPLDNVVARFHLERKRFTALKDKTWLKEYPNSKEGFRKWCKSIDDSKKLAKSRWVDRDLEASFFGVPCHAEFYRYVEWHNLAFTVTQDLPTMVFYYEDYSTRFNEVTKEIVTFLELGGAEGGGTAPDFLLHKEYADYFSLEQTRAVERLVKELSTNQTWKHLAHYFKNDVEHEDEKPAKMNIINDDQSKQKKGVISVV